MIDSDIKETLISITGGELLAIIAVARSVALGDFILLSIETLILGILGGVGGLLGKMIYNFISNKIANK